MIWHTHWFGLLQGAFRENAEKSTKGDCHRQSFQKPKLSSIPRQCAHWHGIYWMRGFFRRKRRNPASLYQVRAGRILKEGGLVCGSKPFSASLSRILSPFLGGTRKGPPEGYPAEFFNRAFNKSYQGQCSHPPRHLLGVKKVFLYKLPVPW